MKWTRFLFGIVFLAFLRDISAAHAGMAIEASIKDLRTQAPTELSTTLYVEGQKIKMDTTNFREGGERSELIYYADQKVAYYVNHKKQSYLELDEGMILRISDIIQEAMAVYSQRTKEGNANEAQPPFQTRKVDGVRKISNLRCIQYGIFRGEEKVQEAWVTSWRNAGIGKESFNGLRSLATAYDRVMTVFGKTGLFREVEYVPMGYLLQIDGYPMAFKHYRQGRVIFDVALKVPRQSPLKASFFEVPESYSKVWPLQE